MSILQALILGIVQGLTEFVPVSSSGHLVLVPWALGWPSPGLAFDTLAHWGTLAAVLAYFWREWLRIIRGFLRSLTTRGRWDTANGSRLGTQDARLAWWIILGTLPAAAAGYLFKDFFEGLFNHPAAVGWFLLATALILTVGERSGRRLRRTADISLTDALLIGLAQAVAIAPGISRSGLTIAAGLRLGMARDAAAQFSFLLATPAILGAGLLQLVEIIGTGNLGGQIPVLAAGFVAAAISGYLCIKLLLAYLRRGRLYVFAIYCGLIGAASLIASALA